MSATEPLSASSAELERCVASGGVAVFPTDTVYGLCCDPESPAAVARLYELKGRAAAKPAALLCFSLAVALDVLPDCGERTLHAISVLLPGPVTLLLANPQRRYPLTGGELLGLRVIDIGLSVGRPVLQSSANHAGGSDPAQLSEVPAAIRGAADLVIDGGPLPGRPSSVVDISRLDIDGSWRLIRAGAVDAKRIEAALTS